MGAEPGEAYVVLAIPEGTDEEFCLELHSGLTELAEACGVELLGGDLNRAPVLLVSVTAVGYEPDRSRLVARSGAGAGDLVVVTGELGGAAAALEALGGGERGAAAVLARQFAPTPRLDAGRALAGAGATAMIDVSDGLGADAGHIAEASGAGIEIDLDRVPVQEGVAAIVGTDAALELAATGGEDYELLACLPPDRLAEATSAVAPLRLTEIGSVTKGAGATLRRADGTELEPRGFKHF